MRFIATTAFLLTLAVPGAAWAQMSEGEQARLCTGDALQFCSAYVPDRQQVSRCLMANRRALSPGCRRAIDAGTSTKKRRHRAE